MEMSGRAAPQDVERELSQRGETMNRQGAKKI
jgi:hypothetical protein